MWCFEERGFRDREEEWEAAAESMTAQSSASSRSLSSTAEKWIEDAEEDAISEREREERESGGRSEFECEEEERAGKIVLLQGGELFGPLSQVPSLSCSFFFFSFYYLFFFRTVLFLVIWCNAFFICGIKK